MAARVGLTGGIGCGKSTVAGIFSDLGVTIIDADQIARTITGLGTPKLRLIAEYFGSAILFPNGTLNRKRLGQIVFSDNDKRAWLEQLLHPEIRRLMNLQSEQSSDPYCIHEIPLLIESRRTLEMDQIVVVHCPQELRVKRLQKSRNMDRKTILAIINNQVSDQRRIEVADHVIDNSGEIEGLQSQVVALHTILLESFMETGKSIPEQSK